MDRGSACSAGGCPSLFIVLDFDACPAPALALPQWRSPQDVSLADSEDRGPSGPHTTASGPHTGEAQGQGQEAGHGEVPVWDGVECVAC